MTAAWIVSIADQSTGVAVTLVIADVVFAVVIVAMVALSGFGCDCECGCSCCLICLQKTL